MITPTPIKEEKIDMVRLKDINSQLVDIIYFLCGAKQKDATIIIQQLTNLTMYELEHLQIKSYK